MSETFACIQRDLVSYTGIYFLLPKVIRGLGWI